MEIFSEISKASNTGVSNTGVGGAYRKTIQLQSTTVSLPSVTTPVVNTSQGTILLRKFLENSIYDILI